MNTLKKESLGRNIFANYLGVFGQIIIAFFLSPFLVHTLGDTRYGIWTIIAAFSGYLSLLDFGVSSAVMRYVAKYHAENNKDKINAVLSSALVVFIIITSCIALLSPAISYLFIRFIDTSQEYEEIISLLIIIVSIDICIFILSGLFKGALSGFQRFDIINITTFCSGLYKALMFYAFLSKGYGLITMALVSISANLLIATSYYVFLNKQFLFLEFKIKSATKIQSKELVGHSKYSFITMLANQIIYYSDVFIIGYFLSITHVTYYTIAWSLCEYIKRFCLAASRAFVPAFSQSESLGDKEKLTELFLSGSKYMMIFSNLLSLGFMVLGGAFISLWMGEKYMEVATPLLVIMFVSLFIQGPQLISYALLQGTSNHQFFSYTSLTIAVVNIILSVILVQSYGLIGVAIGAAIPQLVFYGLLVPWLANKTIDCSIFRYIRATYLRVAFPSLLLLVVTNFFATYVVPVTYIILIAEAILCLIIYLITVYFFSLNSNEKKNC